MIWGFMRWFYHKDGGYDFILLCLESKILRILALRWGRWMILLRAVV
jgi:hypothetical protein